MSEWKEIKFAKILKDESISYGIVQPGSHVEEDSVPILRVQNIKNGKIDPVDIKKVSKSIEKNYKRTRLEGGELLITVVGSIGECVIVSKEYKGWNVARAVSVARLKKDVDINFVKYSFATEEIKHQMYGSTNDTVQPTLNLTELKNLIFTLPSFEEQKSIASILSSLDNKIDLLQRQNQTIEKLAEVLFDSWFEDKDLTNKVSDLIDLQNGYAFRSKSFQEFGIDRVLKIKNIDGGIVNIEETDFVSSEVAESIDEKFCIKTGDILFAMTGAKIGKLGIIPKTDYRLWLNQRVGLLKEKYDGSRFLAYLQLKSEYGKDYIENTATGSAQPNISGTGIENCEFPEISEEQIIEYSATIKPLFEKLISNLGQIRILENLRDTLLPKLMSGEVIISDE